VGLDNIWYDTKTKTKMYLDFEPELHLYGGLFGEHGNGSFRGDFYAAFFFDILGVDLYQTLDNQTVREVAKRLNEVQYNPFFKEKYWLGEEHLNDLCRMFTAYGEAGAILKPRY
jgi:hypothetical protein